MNECINGFKTENNRFTVIDLRYSARIEIRIETATAIICTTFTAVSQQICYDNKTAFDNKYNIHK